MITKETISEAYLFIRTHNFIPHETLEFMKDAALEKLKEFDLKPKIDVNEAVSVKVIVEYLNKITGKNFRLNTPKTKHLIKARLREGFTVDDFKKVIDNKSKDWLYSDMNTYLRPETLFGNKFEGYLNQSIIKTNVPGHERRSSFD